MKDKEELRLVDVKTLAEMTSTPARTLRKWMREGILPWVRWGKWVRFDLADIQKIIDEQKYRIDNQSGSGSPDEE